MGGAGDGEGCGTLPQRRGPGHGLRGVARIEWNSPPRHPHRPTREHAATTGHAGTGPSRVVVESAPMTNMRPTGAALMEKLVSLCKRRGFIFQSSEIYGGINGFWDYGPLGVELKNNLRDAWWDVMVRNPPSGPEGQELQIVGLDCSIISHPR